MSNSAHVLLSAYLSIPISMLAFAGGLTWILVARARARIGARIAVERLGGRRRLFALAALGGALFVWIVSSRQLPLVPASIAILLGLLVAALTPGEDDAECGEEGVLRGWHGRRFEDIDEWRVTGRHLRFRLFGEWTSAPLPAEHQQRIRDRLAALVPERESRFQD